MRDQDRKGDDHWLLDLIQDEAREYIGGCQFRGEEPTLMGFLADLTRKCQQERELT